MPQLNHSAHCSPPAQELVAFMCHSLTYSCATSMTSIDVYMCAANLNRHCDTCTHVYILDTFIYSDTAIITSATNHVDTTADSTRLYSSAVCAGPHFCSIFCCHTIATLLATDAFARAQCCVTVEHTLVISRQSLAGGV